MKKEKIYYWCYLIFLLFEWHCVLKSDICPRCPSNHQKCVRICREPDDCDTMDVCYHQIVFKMEIILSSMEALKGLTVLLRSLKIQHWRSSVAVVKNNDLISNLKYRYINRKRTRNIIKLFPFFFFFLANVFMVDK